MVDTGITSYACLSFSILSFRKIMCNSYFLPSASHKNSYSPHVHKLSPGEATICSILIRHTKASLSSRVQASMYVWGENESACFATKTKAVKARSCIHFFSPSEQGKETAGLAVGTQWKKKKKQKPKHMQTRGSREIRKLKKREKIEQWR